MLEKEKDFTVYPKLALKLLSLLLLPSALWDVAGQPAQWRLSFFHIHPVQSMGPVFSYHSYLPCHVLVFETASQYITQAVLELQILLLQCAGIIEIDHHPSIYLHFVSEIALLSVLLNKMFLPSFRQEKSCLPVRKTPQMPASSTMTCTTPLTFVLHLTGPSTVENQWRSVHSVGPAIPLSSRGKSAGSLQ